ncbi:hypothetical protein SV7mr_53020 [Stieleria bergensis]|uniref:Photosynthesis system II assembly factor Ycf48/Hcf136-like domain-containing protein n=1 Tax=Stieleria bergensis TaxID=2528025 RepID=A0A517T345_9BACT|nr:hypothetical protein SV7mr_53020 [Planctomycetes bacterium SV_7m_r]
MIWMISLQRTANASHRLAAPTDRRCDRPDGAKQCCRKPSSQELIHRVRNSRLKSSPAHHSAAPAVAQLLLILLAALLTSWQQPVFSQGNDPFSPTLSPLQRSTVPGLRRSIPMTITRGLASNTAPSFLTTPAYCDSETLRQSATLRSVRCLDEATWIAVGDHGTILMSYDGGRHWDLADSPVDCRLNDAIWLNRRTILVVGGGYESLTQMGRGVTLGSRDGGQNWSLVGNAMTPPLDTLAWVDSPDAFAGDRQPGASGTLLAACSPAEQDPLSGTPLFQCSGTAGPLSTLGQWQPVTEQSLPMQHGALPRFVRPAMTPTSIQRWVTQSSHTEMSAAGRASTTSPKPIIRASCQSAEGTLICVGDHGQVWRASHSAEPLQCVRQPDTSTGIVVIAANAHSIPWMLLGREALEARIRVTLLVGVPKPQATNATTTLGTTALGSAALPDGLEQAAMQMGVTSVQTFLNHSDQHEQSLFRWLELMQPAILAVDGNLTSTVQRQINQLAAQRRSCQKVVVFSSGQRRGALLHQMTMLPSSGLLAGDFAADCRMLTEPLTKSSPHDPQANGLSLQLRHSVSDATLQSDSLANGVRLRRGQRLPDRLHAASGRRLQVLQARLKQLPLFTHWLQSTANADVTVEQEKQLRLMLDQTDRDDRFRIIYQLASASLGQPSHLAILKEIARRFPESSAGRASQLHVAVRQTSVEWQATAFEHDVKASTDSNAANATPSSRIAANGDTGLPIQQASAQEFQELTPSAQGHTFSLSPFQQSQHAIGRQVPSGLNGAPTGRVHRVGQGVVQASAESVKQAKTSNIANAPLVQPRPVNQPQMPELNTRAELDLYWQTHPVRLLVQDAIERSLKSKARNAVNAGNSLARYRSGEYQQIAKASGPWSQLLSTKPAVAAQTPVASKQWTTADYTRTPPHLDGKLHESMWQHFDAVAATTKGATPIELDLSWDSHFVYLAARVPASQFRSDSQSPPNDSPQGFLRDDQLVGSDRLQISIDCDGDLLTAFELAMTRSGKSNDSLDGSPHWNPTWYFASDVSNGLVTTEIAIERQAFPAAALTGQQWLVNAEIIPAGRKTGRDLLPRPTSRIRADFRATTRIAVAP